MCDKYLISSADCRVVHYSEYLFTVNATQYGFMLTACVCMFVLACSRASVHMFVYFDKKSSHCLCIQTAENLTNGLKRKRTC